MTRSGGRLRFGVAAAVVAVLLAGCTARPDPDPDPDGSLPVPPPTDCPAVTGDPAEFSPGADGMCDTYYPTAGNGGYDVGNYHLDVTYDPQTKELTGIATITATATANLSSFNLDFTGLDTESVTVNDGPAEADQLYEEGELVVTPATSLEAGAEFTTVINYGGRPRGYSDPALGTTGFLTTGDGAIAIGEPEVAATWFPVNDHPRDKATYTIAISAPSELAALSNGILESKQDASRAGYTTWTWRVNSPMAPYLATVVVGNYRVHEDTHEGMPVVLAVHSSLSTDIDEQLARSAEVVDYLETVFGPYPFDALGGIVVNDPRVGFALENQTRPIYSDGFFDPGGDASWVIAHELAHQWYGNSISVSDWSEIWLNEGFATYAEWLWDEHRGNATAQEAFDLYYDQAGPSLWEEPPGAPGKEDLFGSSVYIRGGLTLHALRVTVGDEDFFAILKEWAERKKDGTATTVEFVELAEEISGEDLEQLFEDWLYDEQRPPRP